MTKPREGALEASRLARLNYESEGSSETGTRTPLSPRLTRSLAWLDSNGRLWAAGIEAEPRALWAAAAMEPAWARRALKAMASDMRGSLRWSG